jgi:hypothetical protein
VSQRVFFEKCGVPMAVAASSLLDVPKRAPIALAANNPKSAPILIGGAPRSGTTLLRAIVNAHPNIVCGPELRAVPALCALLGNISGASSNVLLRHFNVKSETIDAAFAEAIEAFIAPLRIHSGKLRIAEKTPTNILHFPVLRRLFPDSPLISIRRDPRDVVASMLSMPWRDPKSGEPMMVTRDAAAAAKLWVACADVENLMRGDPLLHCLRYEDLVTAPAAAIRGLFDFLGEPPTNAAYFHDTLFDQKSGENEASNARVAQPIDRASVGRWRRDLSPADLRAVERVAGDWMTRLGYA